MFRSRFVMFSASSLWIALILVVSVFRGGDAVPLEPRLAPPSLDPAGQAASLADLGDYEGARRLYQEALRAAPEDVSLWYALGVALSHLNQRTETEEAFQYVVNQGRPDSGEVKQARQWLVSAGVLAPPVVFTAAAETAEAVEATASLKGKVTWAAPEGGRSSPKARILVHGVSGPAEGKRFIKRVPLGQSYRFERLPAGSYRLIGVVRGQHLWDLTVDVAEDKEVVLDLSQDNGSNPTVALNQ
ncbi:MAG: tetratricopeptide repeat protein [Candidatus Rokubacteria bacterium]|nr:tetratricopeptide repeat protein [Candidatus Rokubacteria bacterium]